MRNDGPIQAEGPGLDDEGRPSRWWARLLFQPRLLIEGEYRLGMVVIGLAVFLACYIWASVLPQMIANLGNRDCEHDVLDWDDVLGWRWHPGGGRTGRRAGDDGLAFAFAVTICFAVPHSRRRLRRHLRFRVKQ